MFQRKGLVLFREMFLTPISKIFEELPLLATYKPRSPPASAADRQPNQSPSLKYKTHPAGLTQTPKISEISESSPSPPYQNSAPPVTTAVEDYNRVLRPGGRRSGTQEVRCVPASSNQQP